MSRMDPLGGASALINQDFGPLFSQYKITYGTSLEFIADTLYDTQNYLQTGQTQITFFQNASTLGTIGNTNMPLAGMLPDRQGFLIMSIRCFPVLLPESSGRSAGGGTQTGSINDMISIIGSGVVKFNFLNKDYGSFPLWLLPAGGGPYGSMAAEGATADPGGVIDYATNGIPDARDIYVMEQPLFLPPMTKIGVVCYWNVATAITRTTSLKILFDGLMVRPVQ